MFNRSWIAAAFPVEYLSKHFRTDVGDEKVHNDGKKENRLFNVVLFQRFHKYFDSKLGENCQIMP